ncbi:hypothetical protein A4F85_02080 [Delftia sp. GW456-R20]|nr:hypothetical protein A4F85_02080 [Delftia sp. GW456-R20]
MNSKAPAIPGPNHASNDGDLMISVQYLDYFRAWIVACDLQLSIKRGAYSFDIVFFACLEHIYAFACMRVFRAWASIN